MLPALSFAIVPALTIANRNPEWIGKVVGGLSSKLKPVHAMSDFDDLTIAGLERERILLCTLPIPIAIQASDNLVLILRVLAQTGCFTSSLPGLLQQRKKYGTGSRPKKGRYFQLTVIYELRRRS